MRHIQKARRRLMRWWLSFLSAALSTIHNAAKLADTRLFKLNKGSEELQPSERAENKKRFV
jgi:hypothetical protein